MKDQMSDVVLCVECEYCDSSNGRSCVCTRRWYSPVNDIKLGPPYTDCLDLRSQEWACGAEGKGFMDKEELKDTEDTGDDWDEESHQCYPVESAAPCSPLCPEYKLCHPNKRSFPG